ncbi:MAG: glutamine amidotransferase [Patescibacteria group bacterium]|nr:glutamine amidotransferase [Patescibacteria group bacterium]MCL5257775.1 glutamine amidotransferase [Patescibacteria group bacterium]
MDQELILTHLYPKTMNTYGDQGNVLVFKKRAEWRGFKIKILTADLDEPIKKSDFYFFGGGQDQEQSLVSKDLIGLKTELLKAEAENFKPMLLICGGYQLLGEYYQTADNKKIVGAGILAIRTIAGPKRMIGDIVLNLNPVLGISEQINDKKITTVVGFENHSGKTYLDKNIKPLGQIVKGYGNNGEDKTEGACYKNIIGSYGHGSLLAKNPHLADYLIKKAFEVKTGEKIELENLDDSLEWQAHLSRLNYSNLK